MSNSDTDLLEVRLLCEGIYERYGYDFREYAAPSFCRRIDDSIRHFNLSSIGELQHRVLVDPEFFYHFLNRLTVTVSDFFRDPAMWLRVREEVIPYLRTFHSIKIWSAGSSSGEEAYSLAILLFEEGLLNRAIIHATDINHQAIDKGKFGAYNTETIEQGRVNYKTSGGKALLDSYFEKSDKGLRVLPELRERVLFNHHNLAVESSFGEMNLIFCRNAMIYFDTKLQQTVFTLLNNSLLSGGFLVLGSKESLSFSVIEPKFDAVFRPEKVYKKRI